MLDWLRRHALHIATGVLVVAAAVFYVSSGDQESTSHLATYISGIATALAFVWLIASFRVQSTELSLQRDELTLQRAALEQQAVELSNSARLSSMAEAKSILDVAEKQIVSSPAYDDLSTLTAKWMSGMAYWKDILESNNPKTVFDAFNQWIELEGPVFRYLENVKSAMQVYLTFHGVKGIDFGKLADEFIYIYQSRVKGAPYFGDHMGVATLLANFHFMMEPGRDGAMLAGLVSGGLVTSTDLLKSDEMEKMRDKILENGTSLPAICDPWPLE